MRFSTTSLGVFRIPTVEREILLREIMQPIHLPLGDWLDRDRAAHVVSFPTDETTSTETQLTLVLPVLDVADALRTVVISAEDPSQDGIHVIQREGEPIWYLRIQDEYLTVGLSRENIAVDRARLDALRFSAGHLGMEWNFDLIASMAESSRDERLQMIGRVFEKHQSQRKDLMLDPLRLSDESYVSLLRDLASERVSLEIRDDKAIFHARIRLAETGKTAASLRDQPTEFPRIARSIADEPAMLFAAGNLPLTDDLRQMLLSFFDQDASLADLLRCMPGDLAAMAASTTEGPPRTMLLAEVYPIPACEKIARESYASHIGRRSDIYVKIGGSAKEQHLVNALNRLEGQERTGGLTPKGFAPLEANAGFFATIDPARVPTASIAYMGWLDRVSPDDTNQRIVFGAHAESDHIQATLILPKWSLEWVVQEEKKVDSPIPPGLWPPPPAPATAPATQPARLESITTEMDGIRISDRKEILNPKNVHRTSPVYPEILRKSWLGGAHLVANGRDEGRQNQRPRAAPMPGKEHSRSKRTKEPGPRFYLLQIAWRRCHRSSRAMVLRTGAKEWKTHRCEYHHRSEVFSGMRRRRSSGNERVIARSTITGPFHCGKASRFLIRALEQRLASFREAPRAPRIRFHSVA